MLPQEIQDKIFLTLSPYGPGFETLERTRVLQSNYVKKVTEFDNINDAAKANNLDNMKWIYKYTFYQNANETIIYNETRFTMQIVAEFGNAKNIINILEWLKDKTIFRNEFIFELAARNKNTTAGLIIMKWLYENKCPWDESIFICAAKNGDLDNMKWLHKMGCPWNVNVTIMLSRQKNNNNLNNLKWLIDNGCPFNKWTLVSAVKGGNLDIMKYLHEIGIDLDLEVFEAAIRYKHTDIIQINIIKWLIEMRCPWDDFIFTSAIESKNLNIIKYLQSSGCPRNKLIVYKAKETNDEEIIEFCICLRMKDMQDLL